MLNGAFERFSSLTQKVEMKKGGDIKNYFGRKGVHNKA